MDFKEVDVYLIILRNIRNFVLEILEFDKGDGYRIVGVNVRDF